MRLTESIFRNIKEAESVKKPYGDKPQEGKKEKLVRGKGKAVPRGKADNKFKVEKLENRNSQAADIYPNDTAKYANKVNDKSHGDKGKIAKQNTKKASTTINKPFGDKIQSSNSKLIKESDETCEGAGCEEKKEECDKSLKEEVNSDDSFWIVEQVEGAMNPVFNAIDSKFGIDMGYDSNFCTNLCEDIEDRLEEWINNNSDSGSDEDFDESAKLNKTKEVKECNTKLKESESSWKMYQDLIENTLIDAGNALSAEDFGDFLDGVINLCRNYSGDLSQLECDTKLKEDSIFGFEDLGSDEEEVYGGFGIIRVKDYLKSIQDWMNNYIKKIESGEVDSAVDKNKYNEINKLLSQCSKLFNDVNDEEFVKLTPGGKNKLDSLKK